MKVTRKKSAAEVQQRDDAIREVGRVLGSGCSSRH